MNAQDCHAPPASAAAGGVSSRVVLLGRPNSGKSSLYNALTGGSAHVGNYPGITVDVLEGEVELPTGGRVHLYDLPGLYSLASATDPDSDEGVAARFLGRSRGEGALPLVAQIIDGTQLALGLRLTTELLGAGYPLLVVVTQAERGSSAEVRRIADAFTDLVRAVQVIPFDLALKSGPLRFEALRPATRRAWIAAGAAIATGLH